MATPATCVHADEAGATWASVSGAGCERSIVSTSDVPSTLGLKVPAGQLNSCGIVPTAPRAMAGHRVLLSASFRTVGGDQPGVVLMLTQFREGKVVAHDFVTGTIPASAGASLELRAAVLPDIESVAVTVQAMHATAAVDVTDVRLMSTGTPDSAMSRDARNYLDIVLTVIVDHAIALDPSRRDALMRDARFLASGATRTADTYDAIRSVLAQIGDGHSRLVIPSTATAWHALVPKPPYGIERSSSGGIGYLRVPGFDSLDARERADYARFLEWSVNEAVGSDAADGMAGLVIDLRANDGGSWVAMRDGLCSLFAPGRSLGAFVFRDGRHADWTCRRESRAVAASHTLAKAIPIAVLIGPHTASAGEMVAIALTGREHTVSIGAATGGLTTGIEIVPLRDGALLALATSISVGSEGHRYPHGVEPDILLIGGGEASSDPSDGAMVAAREWILANRNH